MGRIVAIDYGRKRTGLAVTDPLQMITRLQKEVPDLRIEMFDERFTSKLAFQAMIEGGVKKSRRRGDKGLVDRVSATIILQGYLESRH